VIARRARITATAALAVSVLGACGAAEQEPAGPAPAALPAKALPYLEAKQRTLTAAILARETPAPGLGDKLATWGYRTGFSRSFQGDSRRLKVAESRTLRFGTARGAAAFVAAVRARPSAFYPGGIAARDFSSRGRHGLVVRAMSCSCHMANPAFLGVVARRGTVSWLEISGPRASVRALRTLADQAP
jgi:hypothetical protein